ncbi:MAG: S1 RNA-binding domain-containing protein [Lachnospiraceae bacterium]|nr:S1 RNA-binding domain-containing protein [Lachnospiraceae bacterium]
MENEEVKQTAAGQTGTPQEAPSAEEPEVIPSMAEFESQIDHSFRKLKAGDIVTGTVIGISDTEVTVDLNSYAEGIIKQEELSNDPRFSIKADIKIGEEISATVLREDRDGNILLSRKQADDVLAWDTLNTMMAERTPATVKVAQVVNAGVVTYLNGIRGFIPASKLDLNYVEDLSTFVGKELEVRVITVDKDRKKLVLSAKDILLEKAIAERNNRAASLAAGTVLSGKVEKIMPFGAFVDLGNGLSGLVHVSQISDKHIKTPSEVLKVGDEVKVRVRDVKDGKISLSMKTVSEKEEAVEADTAFREFSSGTEATTGLAELLKNIKLS